MLGMPLDAASRIRAPQHAICCGWPMWIMLRAAYTHYHHVAAPADKDNTHESTYIAMGVKVSQAVILYNIIILSVFPKLSRQCSSASPLPWCCRIAQFRAWGQYPLGSGS
eukprot:COSAG01_NODE_130_length_24912_cov_83.574175_15_plen_110_part_00